ncbi:MAG: Dam family site-specific DNA-(adenine-N6)-methyltransferase [Puniceicoccales bacterium]|jgi:DNA adenine methylase|nr:Dam family site-specific DNA-(adenine-N6)-methyltransferase [Puniceicoccales bacterium]
MVKQQLIFGSINQGFNETLRLIADENIPERHDTVRPFVKWAGGKRSIIGDLIARIPDNFNSYFEPFVGGGALFWNIPRKGSAYLSDINLHLAITYRMVRDKVEEVISRLEYHRKHHTDKYFATARKTLSETIDGIEIASLLIYLNKTCYNGLYRVNKSGIFNVPMGRYEEPKIVDVDNLQKCSKFLSGVDIFQHGFLCIKPKKGDFVYFDPLYHETFSRYYGSGFGDEEHRELAVFCRQLDQKGVLFMLSVGELYDGFNVSHVDASRFISCKGKRQTNSSLETMSGGTKANNTGNSLENFVEDLLKRNGNRFLICVKPLAASNILNNHGAENQFRIHCADAIFS